LSEALCACNRPIHDTAYRCTGCEAKLRRHLGDVARIAGDITITVAKMSVVTHGPGQPEDLGWWKNADALEAVPMPVDLRAGERHDAAVGELSTWARAIAEDRGHLSRTWVGHTNRAPAAVHPLVQLTLWLTANLEWLRHQPFADEAWPALLTACGQLVGIVDTRPEGRLVCMCQCGKRLYAEEHETTTTCPDCGAGYNVTPARDDLLTQGRELTVTPAEAADLIAGWVDPGANREKVRNLIRQWAHRGLIEPAGDGLYLLGPILDRWTRALAARAA